MIAPVNGLNLYYEIHNPVSRGGAGEPLILLHGGVGGINMFGANVAALARERQVLAVELQGHGRTADIDRPLRFEWMADDIAALLKHLGIAQADIMGYSMGAGVALSTAVRHPGAVRKLVAASAAFRRDGWYPEVLAGMSQLGPEAAVWMQKSPLARLYPDVNWATLFTKLGDLLRQDYDYSKEVAAIRAPTLLVFADADSVRLEHIMEFYGLLGGGKKDAGVDGSQRPVNQLAILPGLTHYNLGGSPLLAAVASDFLNDAARRAKRWDEQT
jgi:pimeloyl-ACP methyl ester carboxylesterase